MMSIRDSVDKLIEVCRQIDDSFEFSPTSSEVVANMKSALNLSPPLLEWYQYKPPKNNLELPVFTIWIPLMLFDPKDLVSWQEILEGADTSPEWITIGAWDGDPVIADVSCVETPIYHAFHGRDKWEPKLASRNLVSYLQAITSTLEITRLEYMGEFRIEHDEAPSEWIPEAEAKLRIRLRQILGVDCVDAFMWPFYSDLQ